MDMAQRDDVDGLPCVLVVCAIASMVESCGGEAYEYDIMISRIGLGIWHCTYTLIRIRSALLLTAFKPEQLAEHAEPRAILHYLVTTWCGAALRADVALAASVP